jgi:hypothetical protein
VVRIFVDEVEPNYRWSQVEVEEGFKPQKINKFQRQAKATANGYSQELMQLLGIRACQTESHVSFISFHNTRLLRRLQQEVDANCFIQFFISSFTNPTQQAYTLMYENPTNGRLARLTCCNCPHFTRLGSSCKHMYYIA